MTQTSQQFCHNKNHENANPCQSKRWSLSCLALFSIIFILFTPPAGAAADRQPWAGVGLGLTAWTKGGGAGMALEAEAGYALSTLLGVGLHGGYANVGTVQLNVLTFGLFGQIMEPESGLYGRLYLDGMNITAPDDFTSPSGLRASNNGFAPGVACGISIPPVGALHFVPELSYRVALVDHTSHVFTALLKGIWDF